MKTAEGKRNSRNSPIIKIFSFGEIPLDITTLSDGQFYELSQKFDYWQTDYDKIKLLVFNSRLFNLTEFLPPASRVINNKECCVGFLINDVLKANRFGNTYVNVAALHWMHDKEAEINRRIEDILSKDLKLDMIDEEISMIQSKVTRGRNLSVKDAFEDYYFSIGYSSRKRQVKIQFDTGYSSPVNPDKFPNDRFNLASIFFAALGALAYETEVFLKRTKHNIEENVIERLILSPGNHTGGRGGQNSIPSFEKQSNDDEKTQEDGLSHREWVLVNIYKAKAGIEALKGRAAHISEGGQNRYQAFLDLTKPKNGKPAKVKELKHILSLLQNIDSVKNLLKNDIQALESNS